MSLITKRSSIPELSQHILEMARTGVYRESVLEALRPLATQKDIRLAIAHAKKFGLHSVAGLRDAELGTYYEVDLQKYETLKAGIHLVAAPNASNAVAPVPLNSTQQLVETTLALRLMLTTVKGVAIALLLLAGASFVLGWQQMSTSLFTGAMSAIAIWMLQKALARKVSG
jgi:hypothetical protein